MERPRKAFVLAAGYGTRMRPLSLDLPKPAMPLWGRPLVLRVLDRLRAWGVREALVNLHQGAGEIVRAVQAGAPAGLRVSFSFEPEVLGTGGALARAAWFPGAAPFWLVNADIAFEAGPDPFLRALRGPRTLAALWVTSRAGPRTVRVRRGRVADFADARPGSPGTATFCGLHLVRGEILRFLPRDGFAGIIGAYRRAQRAGRHLAAVEPRRAWWADLGTPEQYLAAHRDAREAARANRPGASLYDPRADRARRSRVHFAAVAPDARIAAGAVVRDAVVWPGARVERRARAVRAVVGRAVRVGFAVPHVAVRADRCLTRAELRAASSLGMEPGAAVMPLAPRGSARSFLRLRCGSRRVLLVRYGLERPENARYASHARFLARAGLRVPAVSREDPAERFLFLEDLGDRDLAAAARAAGPRRRAALYAAVLGQVIRWHDHGTPAARRARLELEPPFDGALLAREHELFDVHFLRERTALCPARRRALLRELRGAGDRLAGARRALLHRDLQSSNILLTPGGPAFIDFQGMRYGPPAYDLASLLCDPYVSPEPALQERMLARYAREARLGAETGALFWWAAVQRLTQALGAFGRLAALPGAGRFEAHIPSALAMLRRAVDALGGRLPAFADWLDAGGAAGRAVSPGGGRSRRRAGPRTRPRS